MPQTQTENRSILNLRQDISSDKDIPDNVEWIDDAFSIKETRFGLFTSILKEP